MICKEYEKISYVLYEVNEQEFWNIDSFIPLFHNLTAKQIGLT